MPPSVPIELSEDEALAVMRALNSRRLRDDQAATTAYQKLSRALDIEKGCGGSLHRPDPPERAA